MSAISPHRRSRVIDYTVYVCVRLFVSLLQAVPLDLAASVSKFLAALFTDWIPIRKRVLHENLTIAFPDWTTSQRISCIRQMWEHLFLMLAEMTQARRKIHRTNWRDYLHIGNQRELLTLMLSDQPKVIASAHYGNFELAAYAFGIFGYETFAVARTLDNPYLDRFLNEFRCSHGQHLVPKDGSAVEIALLLEKQSTLMLLADQHAGDKGAWVPFFGKPASTHKAIGLFVLGNQAPLGISYGHRRNNEPLQYDMVLQSILDPRHCSRRWT